uniref:J domain-containing protein n=1 Tax=Picocystis salinarum TaxID=88271 RepID=A0A7S3U9M6_9CHLO|mmetsp:Transcript_3733/g.23474  ORF Transcript_3733/g.23474 Transcript_3733/m.23474 type:complete len:218 (+) Transcript_3733:182-835(+)
MSDRFPETEDTRLELRASLASLGEDAAFEDAETEIARILGLRQNFYAVLKVSRETETETIRENRRRLMQIIGTADGANKRTEEAMEVVEKACAVLVHPAKRILYNRYAGKADFDGGNAESYHEWEARQASDDVKIPGWLETMLGFRGVAFFFILVVSLLILPFYFIIFILTVIFCVPLHYLGKCCCPGHMEKAQERAMEKFTRDQERAETSSALENV